MTAPLSLAIAVSGGPDSMALAGLVCELNKNDTNKILNEICLLTVDHSLREGSRREANQVKEWSQNLWPDFQHETLSWQHDGIENRLQEEARNARYDLMLDYCQQHKIDALLVAHHQDDQAETFLMRLAAGSGINGLSGMSQISYRQSGDYKFPILRPLLAHSKQELIEYCEHDRIPYVQDPSNDKDQFARVRLRKSHDVLAEEGLTNKRLSVTASRLARASEALDHFTHQAWQDHVKQQGEIYEVDWPTFQALPSEIALRIIIHIFDQKKTPQSYLPRMERIEALAGALQSKLPFKKRTLGGYIFDRSEKHGKIIATPENSLR